VQKRQKWIYTLWKLGVLLIVSAKKKSHEKFNSFTFSQVVLGTLCSLNVCLTSPYNCWCEPRSAYCLCHAWTAGGECAFPLFQCRQPVAGRIILSCKLRFVCSLSLPARSSASLRSSSHSLPTSVTPEPRRCYLAGQTGPNEVSMAKATAYYERGFKPRSTFGSQFGSSNQDFFGKTKCVCICLILAWKRWKETFDQCCNRTRLQFPKLVRLKLR